MKVGFTGTKEDMTQAQEKQFKYILTQVGLTEFHHGDCVGADLHAHNIVRYCFKNAVIHSHPPVATSRRAYATADIEHEPKDYLERNRDIVDETTLLIATPLTSNEILRSGTWSTIRYAVKRSKNLWIIDPEGYCRKTIR